MELSLSCSLKANSLYEEGALHFQSNVNIVRSLQRQQDLGIVKNKKSVLFTNKWMNTCLPTPTESLIRLTLATLAADNHVNINVMLANINVIIQINVVNRQLNGDSR